MPIHPTAVIDPSAQVDPAAEIGPYAVVEPNTRIGAGTRLYAHAYIAEGTTLGERCRIHPFAVVGHHPQDLKWERTPSYTEIGDDTILREHATVHRGTMPESKTIVGRHCYVMSTGHIGHNCVIGDHVIIVNGALLSGHVDVGPRAFISGNAAVHQFVRIGELAMIGGLSRVPKDVPPFMMLAPAGVVGPNVVGLRRAGLTSEERVELRRCYRILYREGLHFPDAIQRVAALVRTEPGRRLVAFLTAPSKRGYLRLRHGAAEPDDET